MRFPDTGWTSIDPDHYHDALAHDLDTAESDHLATSQRATHISCLSTPTSAVGWADLPCTYILATHDRSLDPELQHRFAQRAAAATLEIPSSHMLPVTAPAELAAALTNTFPTTPGGRLS